MFVYCRATNNVRLRLSIAHELSMMNSNLQLLKEELSDMQNEGLDINQNQGYCKKIYIK